MTIVSDTIIKLSCPIGLYVFDTNETFVAKVRQEQTLQPQPYCFSISQSAPLEECSLMLVVANMENSNKTWHCPVTYTTGNH